MLVLRVLQFTMHNQPLTLQIVLIGPSKVSLCLLLGLSKVTDRLREAVPLLLLLTNAYQTRYFEAQMDIQLLLQPVCHIFLTLYLWLSPCRQHLVPEFFTLFLS